MKAVTGLVLAACVLSFCAGRSAEVAAAKAATQLQPATATTLAMQLAAAAGATVTCSAVAASAEPAALVCALAEGGSDVVQLPPRVSVFSVLFLTDDKLVQALLDDVARQTAAHSVELLVGIVTGFYGDANVVQLGREMGRRRVHSLKVVLWHEDLGLYGCWSYMCAHVATAEYRVRQPGPSRAALKLVGAELLSRIQTNWNPDDRRAPYALQKQAALLDTKPEVDLVAGACALALSRFASELCITRHAGRSCAAADGVAAEQHVGHDA